MTQHNEYIRAVICWLQTAAGNHIYSISFPAKLSVLRTGIRERPAISTTTSDPRIQALESRRPMSSASARSRPGGRRVNSMQGNERMSRTASRVRSKIVSYNDVSPRIQLIRTILIILQRHIPSHLGLPIFIICFSHEQRGSSTLRLQNLQERRQ